MRKTTSYPKEKIRVLLLEGINRSAIAEFNESGYEAVELKPKAYSEAELLEVIGDVHVLGIRSKTQISERVIQEAKKLIGIGCFCIGTNQVNLKAATQAGITVFNSPFSNTRSVAELVIAEAIMLIRHIPEKDKAAHKGEWLKDHTGCYELRGKTMGIIGYGRIGSQVSVMAEAMGMKVLYYDIDPKLPLGNATPVKNLKDLLKTSDIVTLHVPSTAGTKNLMNESRLKSMKEGSMLINLSRGDVVDIEGLAGLLESGHIAGAGIDVFPEEPEAKNEKFKSALQGKKNVILTPHIGGSTEEAQVNIGSDVALKLINLLDTGATMGSVTIPELSLPVQKGASRILHIHHNKPGVLSAINSIISSMGVNIAGQYLKTNESVGYVVLDVEKTSKPTLADSLRQVQHTIKCRVLY